MTTRTPWILIAAIAALALSRLLPHPPNFSPVVAVALFGGAALTKRWLAFAVPLAAMLVADVFIGFHSTMTFVYGGMALVVLIGNALGKHRQPAVLAGAAIAGSAVFFLISNGGVWWLSGIYSHSMEGLLACFAAALPFFHNTVLSTLFYVVVLFGLENWLQRHPRQDAVVRG